jgi:hypothetical protein
MKNHSPANRLSLFFSLASLALFASCANVSGPREPSTNVPVDRTQGEVLSLQSSPSGATAKLSTGQSCTTPCSVKRADQSPFSVTFSKDGYSASTIKVMTNLEMVKQYNRSRGLSVDKIAIDNIRLAPNPVKATLEPAWSK